MESKYNAIHWSPELFEITHVIGRKPDVNQNLQEMEMLEILENKNIFESS